MKVKTIIDNENGRKWEIYKNGDLCGNEDYSVKYYEFFTSCGWRLTYIEPHCSRDYIEYEFEIKVA